MTAVVAREHGLGDPGLLRDLVLRLALPKPGGAKGLGRERLHRKVTRRTVSYELQCLSTTFRWAIRQNYLFVNPVEHVGRFRVPKKSLPKVMTAEELKRFFEACDSWERRVFTIMLLSGMRKGELTNLEWEDVREKLKRRSASGRASASPQRRFMLCVIRSEPT